MRFALLVAFFFIWARPVWCQNYFYQVFGPQQVGCRDDVQSYFIETDQQLVSTTWTILPPGSAVITDFGPYFADIIFYSPGTYTLITQSFTIGQLSISDTLLIYVFGIPFEPVVGGCFEPDSITGCHRVCAFSYSTIQVLPGSVFEFEITGAESYTLTPQGDLEIQWGGAGHGTVTALHQGCRVILCFEILPRPVAGFVTTPASPGDTLVVCKNQQVYFENTSVHGLGYRWRFGDGAQSQDYHTNHAFDEEGVYTVTLTAESICECADEKLVIIQVLPDPAPELDCINSICPETRQRYTAMTDGCTLFLWTISSNGTIVNGGGSADDFIEIIWHDGPDGWVELAVSGCSSDYCTNSNIFRIPIISPGGPVSGDASVCSGEIMTYTAPYFPGTSYHWQVGTEGTITGGQNTNAVTVKWSDVNAVTSSFVEVTYENCFLECGGSDSLSVTITPEIRLSGDTHVCRGGMATMDATAGFISPLPANVAWHIENSAGIIVYTLPGLSSSLSHTFSYPAGEYYWVAVNTSSVYCNEIIRSKIIVSPTPDPPLSIRGDTMICPGVAYGFFAENTGVYSTRWTITDGAAVVQYSGVSCTHTFGTSPPYIVQAVNADILYPECVSPAVSITLQTPGQLTINGPDTACFNSIDTFTTTYINGSEYAWEIIPADHGEIRKSQFGNVEVFWTQSGAAVLRLQACGIMINKPVWVHDLPVFQILGPTAACAGDTVAMTTTSPLFLHKWKDEDGNLIGNTDSVHILPGVYAVALTDHNGCTGEMPFTITEYPSPQVHLSTPHRLYDCNSPSGNVALYANTEGFSQQYTWYKDDISLGIYDPVFTLTGFGTYHVAVTNQYGCTAISEKISYIDCCTPDECNLSLGGLPFPGCIFIVQDLMITKNAPACDHHIFNPDLPGIEPGETRWVIQSKSKGIIDIVDSDQLDYTYSLPGFYFIEVLSRLTGFPYTTGECGHGMEITDTVRAVAAFKHEGRCAGLPVYFEDLSTFLPGEVITSRAWDFGDPASGAANFSADQNPVHIFSASGLYDATLTITLASGCSAVRKHIIEISSGPSLLPVYEPVYCENEALFFYLPDEAFTIQWGFGDPASGIQNSAIADSVFHTYDLPGLYTVSVQATDIYGCIGQADVIVDIRANALSGVMDIDPASVLCHGDTAVLIAPAGGASWLWNTGEISDRIEVSESGQFSVRLHDAYSCSYEPPPVYIEVLPKPEIRVLAHEITGPGAFGPWQSSLEVCYGTGLEIQVISGSTLLYQWTHGATTPVLSFTEEGGNLLPPGVHIFSVTGTDNITACVSDTVEIRIEIFDLPAVPVISLSSGTGCSFNENILQVDSPQAGVTYIWSDGQTGITMTTGNAGHYFVTAINAHGCTTQSNSISINASAPVDQLPGGCFIACDPLTVCLPPIGPIVSYTIFKDGFPVQSGATWPQDFVIDIDGSYTIEVTTPNGCTAISGSLDVVLYTGTGSITVITYFDADGDGVISPGDSLLPGIPVVIISDDGLHTGATFTWTDGTFVFQDYPSSVYGVYIDRLLLPAQWTVLTDSLHAQITTCGDSVVVSLLLTTNCAVTGADRFFELCPGDVIHLGDSIWTDTGTYEMHMLSAMGCDSVFRVVITRPDTMDIGVAVWMDVDGDGVISSADTLVEGVIISIYHAATGDTSYLLTPDTLLASGSFIAAEYWVSIDTALLPANFIPLIFEGRATADDCGEVIFHFLVTSACPTVFMIQNKTICQGDSVLIEGQWIYGAGLYSFLFHDPVTLCDTLLDVYVTMNDPLTFDVLPEYTVPEGSSVFIQITGDTGTPGLHFDWQPPGMMTCPVCPASWVFPSGNTAVAIHITDVNNCTYILETFIYMDEAEDTLVIDQLYAPNVFSPNGDGINDKWRIFSRLETTYTESLSIFDRWGSMVFHKEAFILDSFDGWDGLFGGRPLNPGVFTYTGRLILGDGRAVNVRGDITLVR